MTCPNCRCPQCRKDGVAQLVWRIGQVRAARAIGVAQSSVSKHLNRKRQLPPEKVQQAAAAAARLRAKES